MFITLTELRYIVALAHEKHFGKAAAKCFVSQPTLSIAIKKLESNLGLTIFERNKNQVIITDTGLEIIAKATGVLESVQEIEEFAKTSNDIYSQPIRLGAINTVGPYIFPQLVSKLTHSPIRLVIEEGFTEVLTNKLLGGELDAIIVAKPFYRPNLIVNDLYTEPLDIIVPKNHKWTSQKSKINPQNLINETMLLLDKGNCFRDQVLQICPQCVAVKPETGNQAITTSSIETIKYMVANGIGLSIIPRFSLHKNDLSLFAIKEFTKPVPARDIVVATRKGFSRMKIIHELANIIKSIHN